MPMMTNVGLCVPVSGQTQPPFKQVCASPHTPREQLSSVSVSLMSSSLPTRLSVWVFISRPLSLAHTHTHTLCISSLLCSLSLTGSVPLLFLLSCQPLRLFSLFLPRAHCSMLGTALRTSANPTVLRHCSEFPQAHLWARLNGRDDKGL